MRGFEYYGVSTTFHILNYWVLETASYQLVKYYRVPKFFLWGATTRLTRNWLHQLEQNVKLDINRAVWRFFGIAVIHLITEETHGSCGIDFSWRDSKNDTVFVQTTSFCTAVTQAHQIRLLSLIFVTVITLKSLHPKSILCSWKLCPVLFYCSVCRG